MDGFIMSKVLRKTYIIVVRYYANCSVICISSRSSVFLCLNDLNLSILELLNI